MSSFIWVVIFQVELCYIFFYELTDVYVCSGSGPEYTSGRKDYFGARAGGGGARDTQVFGFLQGGKRKFPKQLRGEYMSFQYTFSIPGAPTPWW